VIAAVTTELPDDGYTPIHGSLIELLRVFTFDESDPPHPESAVAATSAVVTMVRKENVFTMFPEVSIKNEYSFNHK
jgi:hypothetical protein